MDAMRDRELPRIVLATTYYYSKALLSSDRAITQTNERTLIKQLGQWLGLQTFARNKPVLAKDMDLKEMIKEAYMQGRMVAVLPFVEKVLAGCTDSKVFRATNPMIAGLLSLLAEIHAIPRLKLNHCFVIEVTLRTFKLTVADVIPSSLLAGLQRPQFNNPDFTALANEGIPGQASAFDQQQATTASFTQGTSLAAATAAATAPGAAAPSPTQPQRPGMAPSTPVDASKLPPGAAASPAAATPAAPAVAASPAAAAPPSAAGTPGMPSPAPGMAPGMAMSPGGPGAPPLTPVPGPAAPTTDFRPDKLHSYVVVHPQLQPYIDRLALKRLLPIALDRAICEIIAPVVERSVTIACMTTFELVTKDYAVDPDETRLRAAAQAMVSSLAGSLALVTCKEPLRVSLNNQLRTMLQQQQLAPDFLEQAVGVSGPRGGGGGCE
jgi:CCR4-NOT transcription complex subunit 1